MYVSLDRQNPHLAFKTLQYHNMWASYDMLEKNYHSEFCRKSFSQEKRLANACFVCPRFNATYNSRQAIRAIAYCAMPHDRTYGKPLVTKFQDIGNKIPRRHNGSYDVLDQSRRLAG